MKREHTENQYDVMSYYPLFNWRKCYFCNSEFRRERGFQWRAAMGYFMYSCNSCCVSVSHCNDRIVHKRDTEVARLTNSVPPAPPMRTYRSR